MLAGGPMMGARMTSVVLLVRMTMGVMGLAVLMR